MDDHALFAPESRGGSPAASEQRYATYRPYLERLGIRFHALSEPGAGINL